jgi:hypothetical protein
MLDMYVTVLTDIYEVINESGMVYGTEIWGIYKAQSEL